MENDLLHLVIRIDVKHIDGPEAAKGQVEAFGGYTTGKIEPCTVQKAAQAGLSA